MKLTIKIDQERIGELITVDEYFGVQDGDQRAIVGLVTKCLFNVEAGEFYPPEEARKLIGGLRMAELADLITQVQGGISTDAVPLENAG